jgi:hypothetical protein
LKKENANLRSKLELEKELKKEKASLQSKVDGLKEQLKKEKASLQSKLDELEKELKKEQSRKEQQKKTRVDESSKKLSELLDEYVKFLTELNYSCPAIGAHQMIFNKSSKLIKHLQCKAEDLEEMTVNSCGSPGCDNEDLCQIKRKIIFEYAKALQLLSLGARDMSQQFKIWRDFSDNIVYISNSNIIIFATDLVEPLNEIDESIEKVIECYEALIALDQRFQNEGSNNDKKSAREERRKLIKELAFAFDEVAIGVSQVAKYSLHDSDEQSPVEEPDLSL